MFRHYWQLHYKLKFFQQKTSDVLKQIIILKSFNSVLLPNIILAFHSGIVYCEEMYFGLNAIVPARPNILKVEERVTRVKTGFPSTLPMASAKSKIESQSSVFRTNMCRLLNVYCEIFVTSSYGEGRTSLRVRLRHMNDYRIFHNTHSISFLLYTRGYQKVLSLTWKEPEIWIYSALFFNVVPFQLHTLVRSSFPVINT